MEVESSMSQISRGNNCVYDWCSALTYEQEDAYLSMNSEGDSKHHVFHFYSGTTNSISTIRKLTKENKR